MRFSLRTMLILVAAIALLLAQYPYVRLVATETVTYLDPDGRGDWLFRVEVVDGYYLPTRSFGAVLTAECAAAIAWLLYSRGTAKKSFRLN